MPVERITTAISNASLYDQAISYIEESNRLLKNPATDTAKRDEHAADSEIVSLYYLSSIQSLKEITQPSFDQTKKSVDAAQSKKNEKGVIQSVKDWFWGLFGYGGNEAADATQSTGSFQTVTNPLGNSPFLQPPGHLDHHRLQKAIAETNQELVWRLKDMQEFEEELRKSNSKKMDKFILAHIKNCSMDQRNLKQTGSILAHEDLHQRHKDNKEIQKKTGVIADDLNWGKKALKTVSWISISVTASTVSGIALAYFSGGATAVIQVILPLSTLLKSGITLSDGVLKYTNGKQEGELMMHKENTRVNNKVIHERLEVSQNHDEEITHVLKSLRKHLKNHSETERLLGRFGKSNT